MQFNFITVQTTCPHLRRFATVLLLLLAASTTSCTDDKYASRDRHRRASDREEREDRLPRESDDRSDESARDDDRVKRSPRTDEPTPPVVHNPRQTFSQHPRLLVRGQDDFDRVKSLCESDPTARKWLADLDGRARKMCDSKELPAYSKSMQGTARAAFTDITTCAGIYRLKGDARARDRARDEMLAIASFDNWQPKDFIVTSEMMSAMSLGYDWLFDALSEHDRLVIRRAIIAKGVRAGLNSYKVGDGWTTVRHNWNFVCNGGLILASLATAEDNPAESDQMMRLATDSMAIAIKAFAPDGGWEEGPSYWNYATRYAVYGIAAMQTAGMTRQADRFVKAEGFDRTGLFRIYMESPTGRLFNFADCDEHTTQCPQLWWMAREYKQPALAAFEARTVDQEPAMLDLLWYSPIEKSAVEKLPTDAIFRGTSTASLRSSWADSNATYLAIKGGYSDSHHGHLDLGSFVLDAIGERWAIDLGADDYDLPGYGNGAQRWTYYRCRSEGHNTLTINNANQELNGDAKVIAFKEDAADSRDARKPRAEAQGFSPGAPYVVIDLTRAYPKAQRVVRGAMLVDDRDVLLQDEFQFDNRGQKMIWAMHTRAVVRVRNENAQLAQNGKTLSARILSPAGAKFEVEPAIAPSPQAQQPDVRKLIIRIPAGADRTTLAVLFSPTEGMRPEAVAGRFKLEALRSWIDQAPVEQVRIDHP